ncbi:unnamed protein product [Amoebophrya sp. A25]|nr:unnamed protein product [Amoebophrya sp. A25]|eukprot:GSA25T00016148001.1
MMKKTFTNDLGGAGSLGPSVAIGSSLGGMSGSLGSMPVGLSRVGVGATSAATGAGSSGLSGGASLHRPIGGASARMMSIPEESSSSSTAPATGAAAPGTSGSSSSYSRATGTGGVGASAVPKSYISGLATNASSASATSASTSAATNGAGGSFLRGNFSPAATPPSYPPTSSTIVASKVGGGASALPPKGMLSSLTQENRNGGVGVTSGNPTFASKHASGGGLLSGGALSGNPTFAKPSGNPTTFSTPMSGNPTSAPPSSSLSGNPTFSLFAQPSSSSLSGNSTFSGGASSSATSGTIATSATAPSSFSGNPTFATKAVSPFPTGNPTFAGGALATTAGATSTGATSTLAGSSSALVKVGGPVGGGYGYGQPQPATASASSRLGVLEKASSASLAGALAQASGNGTTTNLAPQAASSSSSFSTLGAPSSGVMIGGSALAIPSSLTTAVVPGPAEQATKLTDFKVRTAAQWGLEPGKLKEYIEAPLSSAMSWPPRAAEVKKDLRKYLMKKGISNKSLLLFDIVVVGNARVEGVYKYMEKTAPVSTGSAPASASTQIMPGDTSGSTTGPTTGASSSSSKRPKSATVKWYQHTTRRLTLQHDSAAKRWRFMEQRALYEGDTIVPASPEDNTLSLKNLKMPKKTVAYGTPQLICWCTSAETQAEQLSRDMEWRDEMGNAMTPHFVIKPKPRGTVGGKSGSKTPRAASSKASSKKTTADLSPSSQMRHSKETITKELDELGLLNKKTPRRPKSAPRKYANAKSELTAKIESRLSRAKIAPSASSMDLARLRKSLLDDCAKFVSKIVKEKQVEAEKIEAARLGEEPPTSSLSDKAKAEQAAGAASSGDAGGKDDKQTKLADSLTSSDPVALVAGKMQAGTTSTSCTDTTGAAAPIMSDSEILEKVLVGGATTQKSPTQQKAGSPTGILQRSAARSARLPHDKTGAYREIVDPDEERFEKYYAAAEAHEDRGEYLLASRAYKDALRVRPKHQSVRQRLHYIQKTFLTSPPQRTRRPMLRFVSHYNLMIRYWDQAKATLAIKECENAISILRKFGLPLGGMIDILDKLAILHQDFRPREQTLLDAINRPNLSNLKLQQLNYKLGVLYFDKRMLHRAESFFHRVEAGLKERAFLKLHKGDENGCQGVRLELEGIRDDLLVMQLKKRRFSTEQSIVAGVASDVDFSSAEEAVAGLSSSRSKMFNKAAINSALSSARQLDDGSANANARGDGSASPSARAGGGKLKPSSATPRGGPTTSNSEPEDREAGGAGGRGRGVVKSIDIDNVARAIVSRSKNDVDRNKPGAAPPGSSSCYMLELDSNALTRDIFSTSILPDFLARFSPLFGDDETHDGYLRLVPAGTWLQNLLRRTDLDWCL